ncbi:response regulator transcription factor [Imperialibacter roseus]|uniref:Response regulator transcription factor n=1 Tax=Imperialibacter roseus TaxID=1324217 RepID=A0ABZ0IVW3_9BACT|nr:response regulator transcription factor [Imperialibacter roseus]WOK08652.1 response regulator transcription factor [Imperialibacter roseus]
MAKILIVEDELHMRMGLKDNLEFEGYAVELAEDGEKGLQKIQQASYDLIVLDAMMPKMSGFDVCRQTRKLGIKTPIIFLTAKGEEIDKVVGLEIGADDYMTKPFSLRELIARIKAILRRTDGQSGAGAAGNADDIEKASIGRLTIDFKHYLAHEGSEQVKLSHKEFDILKFLLANKNDIVSRYKLLEDVWGYEAQPTTRTVDNFILKLRQKVEDNPNEPKIILTVHGIGYKMIID